MLECSWAIIVRVKREAGRSSFLPSLPYCVTEGLLRPDRDGRVSGLCYEGRGQ